MTLALTNLDLLHRGWEDAASEITAHLPEVRASMETEYAALQHENRIDEQALLAAVREVAAVAARVAGADKARLLSRSMHRSVYEYLLSLDALTAEEAEGDAPANGAVTDPSRLIGMEEVAELEGRQAALQAEAEAAAAAIAAAELAAAEREAEEQAAAERAAAEAEAAAERAAAEAQAAAERAAAEAQVAAAAEQAAIERAAAEKRAAEERAAAERAAAEHAAAARAEAHRAAAERAAAERLAAEHDAAERAAAYRASVEPAESQADPETDVLAGLQAALDEAVDPDGDDETAGGGHFRPRFKIFRRGVPDVPRSADSAADAEGTEDTPSTETPEWWRGPDAPPAAEPPGDPATPVAPLEPAAATKSLSWVDRIAPPETSAAEPAAVAPAADGGFAVAPRDGFHLTEFADFVRPEPVPEPEPAALLQTEPPPGTNGDSAKPRGWHIRSSNRPRTGEPAEADTDALGPELDEDAWEERRLIDQDPKLNDARGEINDLLRKRRCDDAASLLQKLAADSGGRSVAELALDAGDRCRALGKGNAALSCYIAASRADPSFEGPLMRLADVCLDDRDIDLAVTYLERVARLHRLRGDTRGALRLYRKIATIAPYRDDILATLMRANTTGQFED